MGAENSNGREVSRPSVFDLERQPQAADGYALAVARAFRRALRRLL